MHIRLLVCDLDGTLLRDDKSISAENRRAVKQAWQHGIQVVLATGRPPVGARDALAALAPAAGRYLITYNGALIQDLTDDVILAEHVLTRSDYDRIAAFAAANDLFCYAFSRDTCLTPRPHPIIDSERAINGIATAQVDFAQMAADSPLIKVMVTGEPAELERFRHLIPPDWHLDYNIVGSAPILLEFLSPVASKGQAVRALADRLSLDREQVVCIGDAGNDADMLAYAGLGVAMGNATDDIKTLADVITSSNEEHGVARLIEQRLLA
jgi:hypothetical protein